MEQDLLTLAQMSAECERLFPCQTDSDEAYIVD
jgi:hypothetical protein